MRGERTVWKEMAEPKRNEGSFLQHAQVPVRVSA